MHRECRHLLRFRSLGMEGLAFSSHLIASHLQEVDEEGILQLALEDVAALLE